MWVILALGITIAWCGAAASFVYFRHIDEYESTAFERARLIERRVGHEKQVLRRRVTSAHNYAAAPSVAHHLTGGNPAKEHVPTNNDVAEVPAYEDVMQLSAKEENEDVLSENCVDDDEWIHIV